MTYSVETWGTRGDRIVMVHGSLSVGAAAFEEQRPIGEHHVVKVMIRRGYGVTAPVDAVDVLKDARDVVELLEDGAHLVGTSMGAIVSMNAAGMCPEHVYSLTLIEPPAFALAADLPEVRSVSEAMKRHWQVADHSDLPDFVAGFLKALQIEMVLPEPLPPPLASAAKNLVTERPWKVDVPIGAVAAAPFAKLVITGGWSPAFDAIGRRLSQLLNCGFHQLPGAGHGVQKLGRPFNELLEKFVSQARVPSKGV